MIVEVVKEMRDLKSRISAIFLRHLIVLKDGSIYIYTHNVFAWFGIFPFFRIRDEVKKDMEEYVGRSGKRDEGPQDQNQSNR